VTVMVTSRDRWGGSFMPARYVWYLTFWGAAGAPCGRVSACARGVGGRAASFGLAASSRGRGGAPLGPLGRRTAESGPKG
jgi:hypothetical protein